MLHLWFAAICRKIEDNQRYERLLVRLEQLNAEDVDRMDRESVASMQITIGR